MKFKTKLDQIDYSLNLVRNMILKKIFIRVPEDFVSNFVHGDAGFYKKCVMFSTISVRQ